MPDYSLRFPFSPSSIGARRKEGNEGEQRSCHFEFWPNRPTRNFPLDLPILGEFEGTDGDGRARGNSNMSTRPTERPTMGPSSRATATTPFIVTTDNFGGPKNAHTH